MDEKPKFVPNIPVSRPVRQATAPKKERTTRKRVVKKSDPTEAVASGPFALGPAKRSATKIARSGSSISAGVKIKSESFSGQSTEKLFINSDAESEQEDLEFDALDPNAPLSISNQSNQSTISMHDQFHQNDLILIQVPDILTSIIDSSSSLEAITESDSVTVKQENNMVPNVNSKKGKIGSLVIHPDGRMELRISSLSFDISNAPESHLLQKLVVIDGKIGTDLGKVSQRMMCTPQID